MAERLNAPVLKTGMGASPSRVRIPVPPPLFNPINLKRIMIMGIWQDIKTYKSVRDEVRKNSIIHKNDPFATDSFFTFAHYYVYSLKLMFKEHELLLFVLLQWLSVALGYYLFVMMLYWIPEDVWRSTQTNDEGSIADLVLFVWIIICIGIAALPLGIFSSCMAAVHFLYCEEKPSTIAACLKIVLPRTWALWIFHWIDGYITVGQIIERLPKEDNNPSWGERMAGEGLYYAWKVATMGILPNLITGRNLKDTTTNAVTMIKEHASELLMIRIGYSILCWIIGIGTYVWGIFNVGWIKEKFFPGDIYSTIADFYFYAGVPMLISVAVIQLFIRPAYVIAISDVYARFIYSKKEDLIDSNPPPPAVSAFIGFGVFCLIIFTLYLYRQELGILNMLATPYGEESKG